MGTSEVGNNVVSTVLDVRVSCKGEDRLTEEAGGFH